MAASAVVVLAAVARRMDVVGQLRRYHTLSGEAGVVTRHHRQPATRQPPTRPRLRPQTRLSTAHHLTPASVLPAPPQLNKFPNSRWQSSWRPYVASSVRNAPPPPTEDSTGDGDTHAAPTSVPPPTSQSSLPPVAVSPSLPLTSTHLPAAQGSGGPAPTSGTFSPHQHILKGEGVMYSNSCSLHIGRCGS